MEARPLQRGSSLQIKWSGIRPGDLLSMWFMVLKKRLEPSERCMQSKNKRSPTKEERAHICRIKEMPCGVCGASGPSDAHELKQGQWHTCIPLCRDCHQGALNGIHGQKRIWNVLKLDEMAVLNNTISELMCR